MYQALFVMQWHERKTTVTGFRISFSLKSSYKTSGGQYEKLYILAVLSAYKRPNNTEFHQLLPRLEANGKRQLFDLIYIACIKYNIRQNFKNNAFWTALKYTNHFIVTSFFPARKYREGKKNLPSLAYQIQEIVVVSRIKTFAQSNTKVAVYV